MRGQWTDAEDTCRQALGIDPNDVTIRELLADILHECGKLDMALSEYRAALEIAPGKPSLETRFAKVTLEIAEREREKALAQDMLMNPHKYVGRERSPLWAFLSSAIVPGLGQLYNGDMVKAGIIFGVFLLFIVLYGAVQRYPRGIDNIGQFLYFTNPFVLVLGILAVIAYIYGLMDALFTADKSTKAAKKQAGV